MLESGTCALQADFVELVRDIHAVADGEGPHGAAHLGGDAELEELPC